MKKNNTINFFDQKKLDIINKSSPIRTIDDAILVANSIDWGNSDYGVRNALAYLIDAARKKAIAKVKPLKCPFKMASLFLANKREPRGYLRYIYSTGTRLVASNGHVLIYITHECEPGYYDIYGHRIEKDEKYPNFQKIISLLDAGYECQIDLNNDSLSIYRDNTKCYVYENEGKKNFFDRCYVDLLIKKLGITTGYLLNNPNATEDILFFKSDKKQKFEFIGFVMPLL